MKMTVEVPNDLHRRAKSFAALRGRKLKDLVKEGLRLVLNGQHVVHRPQSLSKLMKNARGVVDSGVSDLASSPRHLTDLGRDRNA
jgi:predicted component of type VI protein secretion system